MQKNMLPHNKRRRGAVTSLDGNLSCKATTVNEKKITSRRFFVQPRRTSLQIEAKKFGYECVNVASDGDCFFHALLMSLEPSIREIIQSGENLRAIVIVHFRDHLKKFIGFIPENERDKYFSSEIENKSFWATSYLITAAADLLEVIIIIIKDDGEHSVIPYEGYTEDENAVDNRKIAMLGYENNNHYQYLIPILNSAISTTERCLNQLIQKKIPLTPSLTPG